MPTRIPALLVNGSSGIAVGMATNVPPHNLTEVLNGCLLLLENPKASIDEIIQIITGPDFPTGGTIDGRIGIYEGYKTGRGINWITDFYDKESHALNFDFEDEVIQSSVLAYQGKIMNERFA